MYRLVNKIMIFQSNKKIQLMIYFLIILSVILLIYYLKKSNISNIEQFLKFLKTGKKP